MNKDVPVAELNIPSIHPGKFTWELSPAELTNIPRKHRSDLPDYHIQLGTKNDITVPQTSTPTTNPINTPLPDSGEISWDSRINFGSSGGPEVVAEQPSSFISVAVSVGGIADGLSS